MKFLVLKNEDIEKYTGEIHKSGINGDFVLIRSGRKMDGKTNDNTYLIVNTDEPYAGIVADLIESEEKRKGTWDHGEKSLRKVMGIEGERQGHAWILKIKNDHMRERAQQAEADYAALVGAATEYLYAMSDSKAGITVEVDAKRKLTEILNNANPGTALPKELEALRLALDLACDYGALDVQGIRDQAYLLINHKE